jgi:hypothetical protein
MLAVMLLAASTAHGQLAQSYPGDIGIEDDPDVLYVEKFDDSIATITSRYDDVKNAEGMSLQGDVPAGSSGPYSLRMTNVGGQNSGGHLYKRFVPGFDTTIYIRYYVKYPSISKGYIHHESIWIGGYSPAIPYPYPRAGICGLGDKRISIAYEPVGTATMNTYLYWGGMHNDPNGNCWGNVMVRGSLVPHDVPYDRWLCVEMMVKLNNPVTASNGELRIWHDGEEVGYWGPGFPNGSWTWDKFDVDPGGPPFEGFRWRTDSSLNLNYIWIEYYDDQSPAGASHYIQFDHLVIARKPVGPIYDPAATVERPERSASTVQLFPNPSAGMATVVLPLDLLPAEITLHDLLGRRVYSTVALQPGSELDLSGLKSGAYLLQVGTGRRIIRRLLIR